LREPVEHVLLADVERVDVPGGDFHERECACGVNAKAAILPRARGANARVVRGRSGAARSRLDEPGRNCDKSVDVSTSSPYNLFL
jgi:hypothetical protein